MRLQREAIKSRIAPLGWNKKRKMCRQCQGLIRAVQRNISPKLITTSLLFLCNSDNNNVHGNSRPTVFQSASDSSGLSFSFSRDYRWANEKNKFYQIRLDQNCVLQLTFRGGNSNRNISSWASSWVCLVFGSLFWFYCNERGERRIHATLAQGEIKSFCLVPYKAWKKVYGQTER
jgi:hypothetical protein